MWVLFITWDDFDMRGCSAAPTNTITICEDEEDARQQYIHVMLPIYNDVAFAQVCYFPEMA